MSIDICKQQYEQISFVKMQPKSEDAAELELIKEDLETRLKEASNEISEFVKNQETLEKIIKDKDRQ